MRTLHLLPFLLLLGLTACQKDEFNPDYANLPVDPREAMQKKKHPVPFKATFISTVLVFPPQPNPDRCGSGLPIVNVEQSLEGNASHMGQIIGSISACYDVSTNPPTAIDGQLVFEAANGDKIFLGGIAPFEINGGTGRFQYATGSVNGWFEAIEPGVFQNYLEGEIQY